MLREDTPAVGCAQPVESIPESVEAARAKHAALARGACAPMLKHA